jgi:aspartate racemase
MERNLAESAAKATDAGWRQTRRVGFVGGMSWPSTALYYERINRALERRCGPHHSMNGVIWSLNYDVLLSAAIAGEWARIETMICEAASGLKRVGCDIVVLTAVTAHLFAETVATEISSPVPHILSSVAREVDRLGVRQIGVLGTENTCGAPFLTKYLGTGDRELLLLDSERQAQIDDLIQNVLTADAVRDDGAETLRSAVCYLRDRGAKVVVLACTELPLLLPLDDIGVPLVDAVAVHIEDICDLIVSNVDGHTP